MIYFFYSYPHRPTKPTFSAQRWRKNACASPPKRPPWRPPRSRPPRSGFCPRTRPRRRRLWTPRRTTTTTTRPTRMRRAAATRATRRRAAAMWKSWASPRSPRICARAARSRRPKRRGGSSVRRRLLVRGCVPEARPDDQSFFQSFFTLFAVPLALECARVRYAAGREDVPEDGDAFGKIRNGEITSEWSKDDQQYLKADVCRLSRSIGAFQNRPGEG